MNIPLPLERFQEDLRYDIQVEMELVRPSRGNEEMGQLSLTSVISHELTSRQLHAVAATPLSEGSESGSAGSFTAGRLRGI